jgi:uncharacterized membrane protein (UPF0127 family)
MKGDVVIINIMLVVFLLFLPMCSNKIKLNHDNDKKQNISRSSAKACVSHSTIFHCDGKLTIAGQDGQKSIDIEYECADTPSKRAQGLMYRRSMEEYQGMLFIFNDIAPRYFYMKNTYIPLDILFIDNEKKVIKGYYNTQPMTDDLLPSIADAKYALEVNGGFCARHGISEGDLLKF